MGDEEEEKEEKGVYRKGDGPAPGLAATAAAAGLVRDRFAAAAATAKPGAAVAAAVAKVVGGVCDTGTPVARGKGSPPLLKKTMPKIQYTANT